LTVAKTQVY